MSESDRTLRAGDAIPSMVARVSKLAEELGRYLKNSDLPGGTSSFPLTLAEENLMRLLDSWRGRPVEGFIEDQILALRRLYSMFWPPDDWTDDDAYQPTWEGLRKLQGVLEGLGPSDPRGTEMPDFVTLDQPVQVKRGSLDERAAIEQKKNPSLTFDQLAAMLKCNAKTLRNPKKYPLLAAVRAAFKAQRDEFRGSDEWNDRLDVDD